MIVMMTTMSWFLESSTKLIRNHIEQLHDVDSFSFYLFFSFESIRFDLMWFDFVFFIFACFLRNQIKYSYLYLKIFMLFHVTVCWLTWLAMMFSKA